MAKKCPKNFTKILQQKTLAESWFSRKKQDTEQNEKNECDENNSVENQSLSNDSDFIESSQDATESKLREKVNQTVSKRSNRLSRSSTKNVNQSQSCSRNHESNSTPQKMPKCLPRQLRTSISTPKKDHTNVPSNILGRKLSISDGCEVNSTVIKEEVDDLIASEEMLSDELEYPISVFTFKENTQSTDENEIQEEQDPLYVNLKEQNRVSIKKENRKRKKHSNVIKNEKRQRKNTIDNEEDKSTEEFLRILGTLCIKLQHTVPPQHKIENCAGSRPLSKKQMLLFESYGPLKRGTFTEVEDKIIKNNWTHFCKIHDWNEKWVEPFLNMRHEGSIYYISSLEERKNFVRFLGNGLPWRSLYSVYFRFKNLYNCTIKSSHYSAEDDKKIIEHISKVTTSGVNKKCAELAKTLNRKRHSVWQRYQKLKTKYNLNSSKLNDSYESDSVSEVDSEEEYNKKKKQKKETSLNKSFNRDKTINKVFKDVKWSIPLANRFIEKLMEIMSCENVEKLKNQTISDDIWKKMEKKIRIHHKVLKSFWNFQLHMQLFCSKSLYLNDLKMDLIQYLYKTITNANSIEWDEVKLNFNGVTSAFLSKLFVHLQKHVKTKLDSTDVKITEIIEYLYNNHIPELKEKTTDTALPKLYHKNGQIIRFTNVSKKRECKGTTIDPLCDD